MFDQMSSVKSRKHFVLADMAFSLFWTVACGLSFLTLMYEWTESDDPVSGFGQGSVRTAILCSFLSVWAWVLNIYFSCFTIQMLLQGGCALFSWQRYKQGCEAAFSDCSGLEPGYNAEPPFQGTQEIVMLSL